MSAWLLRSVFVCPPPPALTSPRLCALCRPCSLVRDCLPFIDLLQFRRKGSIASLVAKGRGLLVSSARMPLWDAGVAASTGSGGSSSLNLNHLQALELENRGEVDVGARITVFAQAFRVLHFMSPRALRRPGQLYSVVDNSTVNVGYGLDSVDQGVRHVHAVLQLSSVCAYACCRGRHVWFRCELCPGCVCLPLGVCEVSGSWLAGLPLFGWSFA